MKCHRCGGQMLEATDEHGDDDTHCIQCGARRHRQGYRAGRLMLTLHPTRCEDCGQVMEDYPHGQLPICWLCRQRYAPEALRAWISWLVYYVTYEQGAA